MVLQVLEGLYKAGKARAIGVSNYSEAHLRELLAAAEVKPVVNQVGGAGTHTTTTVHPFLSGGWNVLGLLQHCSRLS
jgi:diketogulonate reductase-like aldo/keto reductase